MADDMWTYRGWRIDCDPKPIPNRSFDWEATAPDYDVDYDGEGWVSSGGHVTAATYEELLEEIEAYIAGEAE